MPNTDSHLCAQCLRPLIYIPFPHHYRLVCDNAEERCRLFREGQGNVSRDDDEPEKKTIEPSSRKFTLKYQAYLAQCKEGYDYGRSLGLSSTVARDLRYKSKKEIEKMAKELVTV